MAYSKTTWVDNTSPAINATHLNKIETGIFDAHYMATGRCATFVVAANDSSALSKQQADYVCDGTDDDVQIQAAIDAAVSTGGKIQLMEGLFKISSVINVYQAITISGLGWNWGSKGTRILQQHDGDVFYINEPDIAAVTIRDLYIVGKKSLYANGSAIHIGSSCKDTRVIGVGITHMPLHGIYCESAWGFIAEDVVVENGAGDGIHILGNEAKVTLCKIMMNDGWGLVIDRNTKVFGNYFHGNTLGDIWVVGSTGVDNVIYGNNIVGGIGSAQDASVYIQGCRNIFSNNIIDVDSNCQWCVKLPYTGKGCIVKDNILSEATTAMIKCDAPRMSWNLKHAIFITPAASGTNVIAQQNSDFDISAGFTNPSYPRNLQVVFGAGWDGGNIKLYGINQWDEWVYDTIVASPGNTVQGMSAYYSMANIKNLGSHSAGTVDIQTGTKLGLPSQFPDKIMKGTMDGVGDGLTLDKDYATVIPSTTPNGARSYVYLLRENMNINGLAF